MFAILPARLWRTCLAIRPIVILSPQRDFFSRRAVTKMLTVRYKRYFLRILLPGNWSEDGFSPTVKISPTPNSKPLAMMYVAGEPIRTKEQSLVRGFELGAKWIDETLPYLRGPRSEEPLLNPSEWPAI